MIIKLMGIIDLMIAIMILLTPFHIISWKITIIGSSYLLFKAYIFRGDFASMVDGISGIYLLIAFMGFAKILAPIFGIYLLQKSVFSLS